MMVPAKKRAAAYIRMSTDQQENSPERQRVQLEAYAAQKGYDIVAWFEDQAMKGWDNDRPGYQALLRAANEKQFEVIIADELSRLNRLGTIDYFTYFVGPVSEAGVVVDTVSDGVLEWDEEDLPKVLMHLFKSHKGYSETIDLARRTTKGLYTRARSGKLFVGPRPFGLDYARDDEGNRIGYQPGSDEEIAAVRKLFLRYAEGYSLADIAAELNQLGVRTRKGREWDRNKVHSILTNPVYAGDYIFGRVARGKQFRVNSSVPNGHIRRPKKTKKTKHDIERNPKSEWFILKDAHPAIIDRVLFDKVQELLKANQKHTSPSRVKGGHPLSGLLFCPACGHVMYGTTRQLKERIPVYVCGQYIRRRECEGYWVREDEALASIAHALQEKLEDPQEVARLKASLHKEQSQKANDGLERVGQLRQQVDRLDGQIAEATTRLARVPERMFNSIMAEIEKMEAERAEAQKHLAQSNQPSAPAEALDAIVANVRRLAEAIQGADANLIHQMLRNSIERVDLAFRVIPLTKNKRFIWEEGDITLLKSSLLSATGQGRE